MMLSRASLIKTFILCALIGAVCYLHVYKTNLDYLFELRYSLNHQYITIHTILQRFWNVIFNTSVIDVNGRYFIFPKVFQEPTHSSAAYSPSFNVSLVSHCSLHHLSNIIQLSKAWGGPLIVTVFIPSPLTKFTLMTLLNAYLCAHQFNTQVTINIVLPLQHRPSYLDINQFLETIPSKACGVLSNLVNASDSIPANYADQRALYPNNMLRNVGITYATSDFVFVIDVDMIPSPDLDSQFANFIQRHRQEFLTGDFDRTAFIVPVYEMSSALSAVPPTKEKLIKEMLFRRIRPFYSEVCSKCQSNTLYETWRNVDPSKKMEVAYVVNWVDPWEPFYIAKRKPLPRYEEKFVQFGFNRISQVCEMHVAGYNFSVLNNAYLVHQGFKTTGSFHKTKDAEQERNRELFREHKEDLKLKYRNDRRC